MGLSLAVIHTGWHAAWVCLVGEGRGPGGAPCLLEAQASWRGGRWQTPALQPVRRGCREDSCSLDSGGCSMWVCELWTPSLPPASREGLTESRAGPCGRLQSLSRLTDRPGSPLGSHSTSPLTQATLFQSMWYKLLTTGELPELTNSFFPRPEVELE